MADTTPPPDPPIFVEVCRQIRTNPMRPNKLSRAVDTADQKFHRHLSALREIATG